MRTTPVIVLSLILAAPVSGQQSTIPAPERARFEQGVRQVSRMWTAEDGTPRELEEFCAKFFFHGKDLETLFSRLESKFEQLDGHFKALSLELRRQQDESRLPRHPVDELFAAYSPRAHLQEDFFKNKLAFVILLNFPLRTLEDCQRDGASWSRRDWAETRLAQRFQARVPASVEQAIAKAQAAGNDYVFNYNVFMDRIKGSDGKPMFREGLKLISHWGLRDEIMGLYSSPKQNLPKQQAIQTVMERIILQEIPESVIDDPKVFWDLGSNSVEGGPPEREPDTRYAQWLSVARAMRLLDPYYPAFPTHMDRSFRLEREMSEDSVERLLTEVLTSPAGGRAAALIRKRLGRELQPFDIWYNGFKPGSATSEADLDKLVAKRYPDVAALQKALPDILRKLGFDRKTAEFLASKIEVDPARGAGHAFEASMRTEKSHLRTKVPDGGMDYKGFNTAMHELGHCVEQVFSLYRVDHTLLQGVPNSAFTEGYAFVFQAKDMEVLGLAKPGEDSAPLKTLDLFWSLREIAGVSLVEMRTWRWLYGHPDATPAEFREAVVRIAKDVWNEYYAPAFGVKDSPLLAIYSHMIDYALYIPNYPLGYIVAYQVEDYFRTHPLGKEMERQCSLGLLTPEEWMKRAVGGPVSARPVLEAALKALTGLGA
ncbi:MAG: hypothetical protein WC728_10745 [Elusimicrobiota bacterium]